MSVPDFVIHHATDNVGVVVVETAQAGQTLTGWVMDTDSHVEIPALDRIPLGHKIALRPIVEGETVVKYGHDIGRAVAAIGQGQHVHIHNLKTKRW